MTRLALVTGAAGFIGRHVCKELAGQGWRVAGLGHGTWLPEEQRSWGVQVWKNTNVSMKELEVLAQSEDDPEILIHCAGGSSVAYSLSHPREDFQNTVATTVDVLEFSRLRTGKTSVVLPSSAAVYGLAGHRAIPVDSSLRPVSPYGVHKRMAEELCRSYAASWKVSVAVVRLFSVYGEGLRKQLLWDACVKAEAGDYAFFGSGQEVRDWLHVADAASLLVLAAGKASPDCPVVNGGTGIGTSNKDILGHLGSMWEPPMEPCFTGIQRPGDPECYVADTTCLRSWGFTPSITLLRAVPEYVRWFKSEVTG